MLDRSRSRTRARNRDLALHRVASRKYRARVKRCEIVVDVEVDPATLEWLVKQAGWVSEADANSCDRERIGQAISAGFALSAQTKRRPEDDH